MGLRDSLRKRNFAHTPEPKSTKKTPHNKLRFVVQEHHARALHYDFRLELDGVLKSWAIPKDPSLNPEDHRLAVQTEDHPYAYKQFEGTIPDGNYGAGDVTIWDEGWYESRAANATEKMLEKNLADGHLTFILHGKKLKGEFALVKMHNDKDKGQWLLVKKKDEFAIKNALVEPADSQVQKNTSLDLTKYPKQAAPWQVKPMLCTLVEKPFDGDEWLFEVKWDGYRAIASRHGKAIELYSRNDKDFSITYAPITEALRTLKDDVILDGEIVVTDKEGVSHFEWLQGWQRNPRGSLQYHAFDILWWNGRDIRSMPLRKRKDILKIVLQKNNTLIYSDDIEHYGTALFKEMQHRGLEGMVAKKITAPYRENSRGMDWVKVKTHLRQEVVIGGFTEPRGSRKHIGSLLVGTYQKGEFIYAGHSGGGIPDEQRKQLLERLQKLERHTSPFSEEPTPNAPVHWVTPEIVCEMSFSEWTDDGMMRHPTFEGLRVDKKPSVVHKEEAKKMPKTSSTIHSSLPFEPTHLDKVFFPKHGYTKGDLFSYYESVADFILPYLKDRPLSLNRMPNGIGGESFFQKNNPHLPDWVSSADIFSDVHNDTLHWIVGGKLDTLLYAVQLGSIEINPWNARTGHLDKPDWIVIDLDPEGVSFEQVIKVAHIVKEVCDQWDIPTYPKTSGKTGIHLYIPMNAKYTFEQAKNLAHFIVLEVHKRSPKITSLERNPKQREHRIYLDYLQNRKGQTLAAPYSVRPTPDASVSMPLHWDEVKKGLKPSDFTIHNALTRLNRTGDLWKPTTGAGIDLKHILKNIESSNNQS